MKRRRPSRADTAGAAAPASRSSPTSDGAQAASAPQRGYGRRRAAILVGIHVLAGVHIAHWRLHGTTLAPLELNEAVYTLELGIVTAGFLLMAFAALGTLVFGRFFCSWACHILALQDACGWILEKLHIRPKPVRSRALVLVPGAVMFSMFVWPQALRLWRGDELPVLHLRTDAQGWSSFVTADFWRNLPTIGVALTTFFVCGFVVVYVLGTRAFCSFGCPYGAIFAILDRVAPGRIVSVGDCSGCGRCTAACTSHILVHEELKTHGMVVNSACLRDLDCVASCPEEKVAFGFTAPPLLRREPVLRPLRRSWEFGWAEELQMAVVCLATVLALRGLYGVIPFFLSVALGCIAAYASVLCTRSWYRRDVRFNLLQLRREGRVTPGGWAFLGACALAAGGIAHSGVVRWHEYAGDRAFETLRATTPPGGRPADSRLLESAERHLETRARLGLVEPAALTFQRGVVRSWTGDVDGSLALLERALADDPADGDTRLALSRVLAVAGEDQRALDVLDEGLAWVSPEFRDRPAWRRFAAAAHDLRARILAGRKRTAEARSAFAAAIELGGETAGIRLALGELAAAEGDVSGAEHEFARAVEIGPDWAPARFNHGGALAMLARFEEARAEFEACVALDPGDPDALFNLARILRELGRADEAARMFERAERARAARAPASGERSTPPAPIAEQPR